MKRILTSLFSLLALSLVFSCEKAEPAKPDTTYTVTMAMSSVTPTSTVQYDLTAYEYNDAGEKVANNALNKAVKGSTKTFTANSRAVKVKLYIKMYSDNSAAPAQYYWVQQVFYLEEGKNIEIKVEDHTKVGKTEP
jgi:hypothetical protein